MIWVWMHGDAWFHSDMIIWSWVIRYRFYGLLMNAYDFAYVDGLIMDDLR